MTGFGAAEGEAGGRRIRAEIRTVNHRWFNASVRVPGELAAAEPALREQLRAAFGRGHVTATLSWVDGAAEVSGRVDHARAAAVAAMLRELRDRHQLGGEITAEQVLRFPDVLGAGRETAGLSWDEVAPVVASAIEACLAQRRREGEHLALEIGRRLDAIEERMRRVADLVPARLDRELLRLRQSVRELLDGVDPDPARLAQEIALLADRVDVTEEMVRLGAHLAAARLALAEDGAVGKGLGFLAQEIGREINTIGSKANDAAIAHDVVAMKGELEKIREQLENLE
jgi:uncharacterized protein (TIGR00255 family)